MKSIALYPDALLTTKCEEVLPTDDISVMLKEMEEVMNGTPNAIGLSANQIGYSKKICLMRLLDGTIVKMINPKIIENETKIIVTSCTPLQLHDRRWFYEKEMCLSVPGVSAAVFAPEDVEIEYLDEKNEKHHDYITDKLQVRCIFHELHHLEGQTIIERVNKLQRGFILKKYAKVVERIKRYRAR